MIERDNAANTISALQKHVEANGVADNGACMKRITIDPRTDQRWQSLIESQPSSIFHTPAWIGVLSDTYDFDIKANILVEPDDASPRNASAVSREPIAGLTYCKLADIRGRRISALPFCDYIDPLVQEARQWEQLA